METIHLLIQRLLTSCIFVFLVVVSFVVQGFAQQRDNVRRGWTMVGMENGTHEVLRSINGSFGGTNLPFTISIWLFDPESKQLYVPEKLNSNECVASLKKSYLPISIFSYPAGNFSVETHLFVNSHGEVDEDAVAYCRIIIQNNLPTQANAKLIVAIRPQLVNGDSGSVSSILFDKESMSVSVNDSIKILLDEFPEMFLPTSLSNNESLVANLNEMNQLGKTNDSLNIQSIESKLNDATAVLSFPVSSSEARRRWQTTLQIPMSFRKSKEEITRLRRLNAESEETDVARYWERRLRKDAVNISLPDEQAEHTYYTSLAYLLINIDDGMLQGDKFFRGRAIDNSLTYQALLQSGFYEIVKNHLLSQSMQTENYVSQIGLYYRFTHDKEFVRSMWNSISNDAEQYCSNAGRINELGEAEFLARELGERDDAKRFKNAVKELNKRGISINIMDSKNTSFNTAPGLIQSCAEAVWYMCSLRSALLFEEKERLILCSGIPREWLHVGEKLQIENMPTHWGTMSYTILVGKEGKKISFKLSGDVEPPDGFILRLPFKEDEIERATINRRETSVEESGDIELEPGTHSVSITLKKAISK